MGRGVSRGLQKPSCMEVRGAQFGNYDARHIGHVQREIARSVKHNLLRQLEDDDLDEAVFQQMLLEDLVDLSPEAKEYLLNQRRDRRKLKNQERKLPEQPQGDFAALLSGLDDLRQQVDDARQEMASEDDPFSRPGKPFLPPQLTLSAHVPRSGPQPSSSRTTSSDWDTLSPAGDLARKMVFYAPSPAHKVALARELQVFGHGIISQVKSFGVKAIILERNKALTDLRINNMMIVAPSEKTAAGVPWSVTRGLYCGARRLFVVGEELLGTAGSSTARHEFAHAYDHVFSEKNGRKMPLSVQLWNSFANLRAGFISDYARTNPAEYFAESVEAFFREGARDYLRHQDPQMFDYLRQLFAA